MARPPLPASERKDDRLPNLRVTVSQRAMVEREAEAAGLTLVEFCRRAIFKTRIPPATTKADAALLVELNRVGVNLNQIARAVNRGANLPDDFHDTLAEIRQAVSKVMADGS